MKFALAVSGRANPRTLERLAIKADELGYDCFLVTDHFLLPASNSHIDVWSFLPYLAAKTRRIRLGTCVTPLPFRNPGVLAKMISTSDNLSNGRITVGAGFGWYRPEFDAFGTWLEARERIAFSTEAIEFMIRLWTENSPLYLDGRFIHAKGAIVEPKPVQKPYPPILWGGHKPASLEAAARYADGWMPIGPRWFDDTYPKPDDYAKMRNFIMDEMSKNGRLSGGSKEGNSITARIPRVAAPMGTSTEAKRDFIFTTLINATPDIGMLRKDVEQYIAAGMNYFILGEKATDEEASLKNVEFVARDVGGSL